MCSTSTHAAGAVEGDADDVEADLAVARDASRRSRSQAAARRRRRRCLRGPTASTGRSGPEARAGAARLDLDEDQARARRGRRCRARRGAVRGVALDDPPAARRRAGRRPAPRPPRPSLWRATVIAATLGPRRTRRAHSCASGVTDSCTSRAPPRAGAGLASPPCSPPPAPSPSTASRPAPVRVEVDVHRGLPAFSIVGLPDAAVREARERVRAAIVNSASSSRCGGSSPTSRRPSLRKAGPGFDLAIAAALLAASGQLTCGGAAPTWRWPASWRSTARSGRSPARWRWPRRRGAGRGRRRSSVAGRERRPRRRSSTGGRGGRRSTASTSCRRSARADEPPRPDAAAADARAPAAGAARPRRPARPARAARALEVAAAGGHSLLMIGPPGAGKSLAARRLPSILPPLAPDEALEVARIASACGRLGGAGDRRPAPVSRAAPHDLDRRAGRRRQPAAGRARSTLAHRGVLFLDELCEFSPRRAGGAAPAAGGRRGARSRGPRDAIELPCRLHAGRRRQPVPLRARRRARATAAAAPPPCARYEAKLSGALADRIDISLAVAQPDRAAVRRRPARDPPAVRERVIAARERQAAARRRAAATRARAAERDRARRRRAALLADSRLARRLSGRGHERVLRAGADDRRPRRARRGRRRRRGRGAVAAPAGGPVKAPGLDRRSGRRRLPGRLDPSSTSPPAAAARPRRPVAARAGGRRARGDDRRRAAGERLRAARWPASSAGDLARGRAGRWSAAWRSGSTAPRTAGALEAAARRSPCSAAGRTSPTRPCTAALSRPDRRHRGGGLRASARRPARRLTFPARNRIMAALGSDGRGRRGRAALGLADHRRRRRRARAHGRRGARARSASAAPRVPTT